MSKLALSPSFVASNVVPQHSTAGFRLKLLFVQLSPPVAFAEYLASLSICYNARMGNRNRKGQAALEYVLALAALLAAVAATGCLVAAARRSADRAQALVGSDYP